MQREDEQKREQAPAREAWETPRLTIEDVEAVTRGGPFATGPGDDGWYRS